MEQIHDIFGDFLFCGEEPEIGIQARGDGMVAGRDNLRQTLLHRVRTLDGELIWHPLYGCAVARLIGKGSSEIIALLGAKYVEFAVRTDDRIADVSFEGRGCAISVASASLMTEMLMGRTVAEAEALMGGFLNLVKGDAVQGLDADDRERLEVMAGVSAFPMRVKCATLAWHAMKAALDDETAVRTE